jgi:hypothetical protein
VGELREFRVDVQVGLTATTVAAVAEAQEGIRRGQELMTWTCRKCDHGTNDFPSSLYDSVALPKDWPYPSDGFFRNASKELVASHGPVVRVKLDDGTCLFRYQDGHEVVVGNPGDFVKVKVDIDLFPPTHWRDGLRFTQVFFAAAGISIDRYDIYGQSNSGTYTVRDGRLSRVRNEG